MAKADLTGFRERLRMLGEAGRSADRAAVEALGGFFIDTIVELTPNDTNRADNGWIQAGREAGVTQRSMLPYMASGRRAEFIGKIQAEIEERERSIAWMRSKLDRADRDDAAKAGLRRKDGKPYAKRANQQWYKDLKRAMRRSERRLKRSYEELAKATGSESFIFFDAAFDKRRYFSTVRDTIYGGTGRIEEDVFGVRLELINREPHVRLIERNPNLGHPYRTASSLTRAAGFAIARDKYFETSRRKLRTAA